MAWLNYHHLLYFWTVAKRGSVAQASAELRLAQSTISAQIRMLEEQLGQKLFSRSGRNLVLTESGRVVYRYADEIFSLGRELVDVVSGGAAEQQARFTIGITDAVPKLIAWRVLEPAFKLDPPVRVIVDEDKPERLFSQLATHALDMVLHDAPIPPGSTTKAYDHPLGTCGVDVFAAPSLYKQLRAGFPESLERVPLLLPTSSSALRLSLDEWFRDRGLRPNVRGEVHDTALIKVLGQAGVGAFVGPDAIRAEIEAQHQVRSVGSLDGVVQHFYAINVERRIAHSASRAIVEGARARLFG